MTKFLLLPMILFGVLSSAIGGYVLTSHHDAGDGGRSRPVVLGVGDSFELPDGSTLEFVELVQDSRCPADAMTSAAFKSGSACSTFSRSARVIRPAA